MGTQERLFQSVMGTLGSKYTSKYHLELSKSINGLPLRCSVFQHSWMMTRFA